MKINYLLVIILSIFIFSACEEIKIGEQIPLEKIPIESNVSAWWGYGDYEVKGFGKFHEDLAVVKFDSLYGYIDKNGKVAIKPVFKKAYRFSDGLASVQINGKFGYINKEGEFVINPQYKKAFPFSNGIARVNVHSDSTYFNYLSGYINLEGKWIAEPKYEQAKDFLDGLAAVKLNGKWGFIDANGQMKIPNEYINARSFSEGLAAVKNENGLYGYINKDGSGEVPFKFIAVVNEFHEGLARVIAGRGQKEITWRFGSTVYKRSDWKPGNYGYINKSGEIVIPVMFPINTKVDLGIDNKDYYFHNGLALKIDNGFFSPNFTFIDRNGNTLKNTFDDASPFSEGLASVRISNDKYGFIDNSGLFVIKPEYDDSKSFSEGKALVKVDGNWLILNRLDKTNKIFSPNKKFAVTKIRYSDINDFFKIIPPPGWQIQKYAKDPRGKVAFIGPDGVELRILAKGLEYDSFDEMLKEIKGIEKKIGTNMNIEKIIFAEMPAVKRKFTLKGTKILFIDFMIGTTSHNLMYSASPSKFGKYLSVAQESMNTYEPTLRGVNEEEIKKHVLAKSLRLSRIFYNYGNYDLAMQYIIDGLDVFPNNPELLKLKDRLSEMK